MSKAKKISKENESKYVQLGLNIAYYRKLCGFTQEKLAEEANLSRSYLSALEAPKEIKSMSLEVLFTLAKVLKIEPKKLLDFKVE